MSLYDERESIHPRAFALRHAVLEEVKARRFGLPSPDPATDAALVRAARALEVAFDPDRRAFRLSAAGTPFAELPLDALRLYERRPADAPAGPVRDDPALASNRAVAARLLDQLLARLASVPA